MDLTEAEKYSEDDKIDKLLKALDGIEQCFVIGKIHVFTLQ